VKVKKNQTVRRCLLDLDYKDGHSWRVQSDVFETFGLKVRKLFVLVISAILLTGCATATQSNSEYSSDDIAFAEQMIPHHEQAIELAEIALLNTTNPEVLQLAQEIKTAQSPEIELMKSWTGVKASTHAGHAMDGMLSDSEISDLRQAKGKEFDVSFLQAMIKHHQGAIKMAQEVANSVNKDVANLSAAIIQTQELEIAKMNELLLKS
jgi:uncharacterized protein (DUF305 family)